MSITAWMGKENVVYINIHNGILLSVKKEGNPTICKNMDRPGGHCANLKESNTEKQILYDLTG